VGNSNIIYIPDWKDLQARFNLFENNGHKNKLSSFMENLFVIRLNYRIIYFTKTKMDLYSEMENLQKKLPQTLILKIFIIEYGL